MRGSSAPAGENLPQRVRLRLRVLLPVVLAAVRDADLAAHRAHVAQRRRRRPHTRHHRRRAPVRLLLLLLHGRRRVVLAAVRVVADARVRMRRAVLAHPPRRDRHADLHVRRRERRDRARGRAEAGREVPGVARLGAGADERGRGRDDGVPGLGRAPAVVSPPIVLRRRRGRVLYLREDLVLALACGGAAFSKDQARAVEKETAEPVRTIDASQPRPPGSGKGRFSFGCTVVRAEHAPHRSGGSSRKHRLRRHHCS